MAESVSADTDDLGSFVSHGASYLRSLREMAHDLAKTRSMATSQIGGPSAPSAPSAQPSLEAVIDHVVVSNEWVEAVRDTLLVFETDSDPVVVVDSSVIELGLAEAGFKPGDVDSMDADTLADRVEGDGLDEDGGVVAAGASYRQIVSEIDEGDDLGMSNGELNRVHDELEGLPVATRQAVFDTLDDDQLEVLFHNVHSSGAWSNDWDDRERTEFYALLNPLSTDTKTRAGQFSPYLEAMAEAETAVASDPDAEAALISLRASEGFTGDLDFDERAALLWQSSHYPNEDSIWNLERLAGKDWFVDFNLEDTQRSAKMIAFVAQHGGDPAVIDNTLNAFLDDDAPYDFDWEKDGSAYGSAGGDEFHFNRKFLDAGNDPVHRSVPTGEDYDDTEHMVTHTVAHEVNHLINGDSRASSYEYFMGEYRAYYVGHLARYGSPPTRADVEARVRTFFNSAPDASYGDITAALDDSVEGPLIADFAEEILGRPATPADLGAEFRSGVTDPGDPAPPPVAVDGGPNNLDNSR